MEEQKHQPNYLVWDIDEVSQVCTNEELLLLDNIIERMNLKRQQEGRTDKTRYLVIADNKPYYRPIAEILGLIQLSEK